MKDRSSSVVEFVVDHCGLASAVGGLYLSEVLTPKPVGVLVPPAVPWAARVAEGSGSGRLGRSSQPSVQAFTSTTPPCTYKTVVNPALPVRPPDRRTGPWPRVTCPNGSQVPQDRAAPRTPPHRGQRRWLPALTAARRPHDGAARRTIPNRHRRLRIAQVPINPRQTAILITAHQSLSEVSERRPVATPSQRPSRDHPASTARIAARPVVIRCGATQFRTDIAAHRTRIAYQRVKPLLSRYFRLIIDQPN